MDPVRRQYETFPYPERDPAEERARPHVLWKESLIAGAKSAVTTCIAAILLIGASFDRAVAYAESDIVDDVVSEVAEDGAIRFRDRGNQPFRAWGIRPNVENLRKLILGQRMRCVIIRLRIREGEPIPVGCIAELNGRNRSLRDYMLLEGMGVEDCRDTKGGYTKMLRQLARDEPNLVSDKLLRDPNCPELDKQ